MIDCKTVSCDLVAGFLAEIVDVTHNEHITASTNAGKGRTHRVRTRMKKIPPRHWRARLQRVILGRIGNSVAKAKEGTTPS